MGLVSPESGVGMLSQWQKSWKSSKFPEVPKMIYSPHFEEGSVVIAKKTGVLL